MGSAGFRLEWASGIGVEGTYANFRLSLQNVQLDDQLPFTRCCHSFALVRFNCKRQAVLSNRAASIHKAPAPSPAGQMDEGWLVVAALNVVNMGLRFVEKFR